MRDNLRKGCPSNTQNMFDIFGQIKAFIKSGNSLRIDNNAFTIHYRTTVIILVVFTLVISSRKYFGDPIDCSAHYDKTERFVDNFCWFNSYILLRRDPEGDKFNGINDHLDERSRYKTVINSDVKTFEDLQDPKSRHIAYFVHAYQWIEFILTIQAVLFFLPRYLWRYCWEGGRVKALTERFQLVEVKQVDDKESLTDIVRYVRRNKFHHFEYATKYVICELLNFANVLAQYLIIRKTLGISWAVLLEDFFTSMSNVNPTSDLAQVFPSVARCEVPTATGGGHVYAVEFCVLPLNVFTTKMYIFLWFYFLGLTVITGLSLLYRLAVILIPQLRSFLIKRSTHGLPENSSNAIDKLKYPEWFLLYTLGKNMDSFTFKALVTEYNDELSGMTGSRPDKESFSFISSDKIYNADLGAMRSSLHKDSDR